MAITQAMMDDARDDLYKAVWALVKAEQVSPNNTGDEQEELSRAIIENDNLSYLYGQLVAALNIITIIDEEPELGSSVKDTLADTIKNIYLRSN